MIKLGLILLPIVMLVAVVVIFAVFAIMKTSADKASIDEPTPHEPTPPGRPSMPDFVELAKRSELPEGSARCVRVGDQRIALYNVDGAVYATDDMCTHADASLAEGTLDGHEIVCPLHFAAFDVKTGACTAPPACEDLRTYEVRVNGDAIEVAVEPSNRT